MNEKLSWHFDAAVVEWLIVLAVLVILSIVGTVVRRRSLKAFRKLDGPVSRTDEALTKWHALDIEQVFASLSATPAGLPREEAVRRLEKFGPNRLPEPGGRGPLVRFFSQFHNVLIYVLLAAIVITAILGHWIDAGVILGVVLVNAVIGFIQEGKAEDALRAIRQMLSPNAVVLRDGRQETLQAETLVPGDVALLQSGDKVPADLRLFRTKGLQIQESILTGESMAVEKTTAPVEPGAMLGDRLCMAYSGTLVTHGQGAGVVVATGAGTEIGRISTLVSEVETLTTPLLRRMAEFGRWLTIAILAIAVLTFAFGVLFRGRGAGEMFLAAVSLAVAAIPEGLPAIMTITLAIGVQRMARRNAIIRRLPAVETLGSVLVICSDKTGTLTRNEMTVRTIATSAALFRLSGTGYDPHGLIRLGDREVLPEERPLLLQLAEAAVLCNDASLEREEEQWRVQGDPMEGALLVAGIKAGLDVEATRREYHCTDLIPFESEHRFMATLHHSHAGEAFVFVKGAPEQLLEMCDKQQTPAGERSLDADYWNGRIEEGRTVYDNLRKAILFILPTNGGEALVILAAVLLGFGQLPLTPVQILWVNMITAVTLALSLAFEPPENNVMRRPPIPREKRSSLPISSGGSPSSP